MLEPGLSVFLRRLVYLAAFIGYALAFGAAFTMAEPAVGVLIGHGVAAGVAFIAFAQDWRLERVRKQRDQLAEMSLKARDTIDAIQALCADFAGGKK